jgi:hypothetical protein
MIRTAVGPAFGLTSTRGTHREAHTCGISLFVVLFTPEEIALSKHLVSSWSLIDDL